MRISDWSSDVCSSDLVAALERHPVDRVANAVYRHDRGLLYALDPDVQGAAVAGTVRLGLSRCGLAVAGRLGSGRAARSEEHTSELQSIMRISYAVFCL